MIYHVTTNTAGSKVVTELNAGVLRATFAGNGLQSADLYTCPNSPDVLVEKGTCAPIRSTFVKTVNIFIP